MATTPITPIKSTTQIFLEIEDINQDIVMMADGSCCMILETTAVNFSLLSEREQEAMIFAFSGLLNSLSFPIQIYIRSKRKDVSGYLERLMEAERKQTDPTMAERIKQYRQFISTTVKERNVLDKKFYLVIPFSSLELGIGSMSPLTRKKGLPYGKEYIFNRAKTILTPKRDHLLRQLARLGLKGSPLVTEQLVSLFHDIYNQDETLKPQRVDSYFDLIMTK